MHWPERDSSQSKQSIYIYQKRIGLTMTEMFDVAIVGGGPAGSTTAALLAKKGYSVFLVEKEKFPRYHIGESTVPGILSVFDELGITEEIEQRAFVVKKGNTLVWGRDRAPWSVCFTE